MTIHGHMPPDADIEAILADPGGACPDCVRIVIEGFRAEVERLRAELATVRREAHRDRLAANGAIDRIDQLAGERNQAEADVSRAEAERDRLAEQVKQLQALTQDEDGNVLPPESELPVGVLYGVLYGTEAGQ